MSPIKVTTQKEEIRRGDSGGKNTVNNRDYKDEIRRESN